MPTNCALIPNLVQSSQIGQNWQLGQSLSPENALRLQDIERRQQIANLFTQQAMTPKGAVRAGNRFVVAPSGWEHAATLANALVGAGGMYMAGQERQELMADIIANRAKGMKDLEEGIGTRTDWNQVDLGLVNGYTPDPDLFKGGEKPTITNVENVVQGQPGESSQVASPPPGLGNININGSYGSVPQSTGAIPRTPTVTTPVRPEEVTPLVKADQIVSTNPGVGKPPAEWMMSHSNDGKARLPMAGTPNYPHVQWPLSPVRTIADELAQKNWAVLAPQTRPPLLPGQAEAVRRPLAPATAPAPANRSAYTEEGSDTPFEMLGDTEKIQLAKMATELALKRQAGNQTPAVPDAQPTGSPAAETNPYMALASQNISKPTHEGLRLKAYPDGGGWSIGYGHHGPDVHKGDVITKEQAERYRDADLAKIDEGLTKRYSWFNKLGDNQKAFIVELAYNVGLGDPSDPKTKGLASFKRTLGLLEQHDFTGAAQNLLKTPWAKVNPSRTQEMLELLTSVPNQDTPNSVNAVAASLTGPLPVSGVGSPQMVSSDASAPLVDPNAVVSSDVELPSNTSRVAESLLDAQGLSKPPDLSVRGISAPSDLAVKGAFEPKHPFSYSYKEPSERPATPEEKRAAYLKAEANPDPLVQRAAYRAMEMDDRDEQKRLDREAKMETTLANIEGRAAVARINAQGKPRKLSEKDKAQISEMNDARTGIAELKAAFSEPGAKGATGPFIGRMPSDIANLLDPRGVRARAAIAQFTSQIAKIRSGLNVTAQERELLDQFLPSGKERSYEVFASKLASMERLLDAHQLSLEAILGYEPDNGVHSLFIPSGTATPAPSEGAAPKSGKTIVSFEEQ